MVSGVRRLVIVFDLGLSGKARAQASSVGFFCFKDELPGIQVRVIGVLENASGVGPFLLLRAVGSVSEQHVVEAKELFGFDAGAVVKILAPVGLLSVGLHGWSNAALEAWEKVGEGNGCDVSVGGDTCFMEGLTCPSDVLCRGRVLSAVRARAIVIFVDRSNEVRRHFASAQDRLEESLFFIGEAFVDLRCLGVDFPQAPQHRSVAAVLGLRSGPCCGLEQ